MSLARYTPPSVLCDEELNILEFRGDTSAYLVNPSGPPSSSLKRLARPEVLLAIDEAVRQARREATVIARRACAQAAPATLKTWHSKCIRRSSPTCRAGGI